ncbi:MAG: hypothetical protein ABSD62_10860 [Candidatus Limnocylindrales bacterium]
MPVVNLGALFLLTLLLPAYGAGVDVVGKGSESPVLLVFGVGGAAGVGALLSLAGSAVWNFLWPISPTGGWLHLVSFIPEWPGLGSLKRQLQQRSPAKFRAEIARGLGQHWICAEGLAAAHDWPEGDQAVVATAFLLYSEAPTELREWIRRRYTRFSDALASCAAIVLGIVADLALYRYLGPIQVVLLVVFGLVALATFAFGHAFRREAVEMERYWFRVRKDPELQRAPVTQVALVSAAQPSGSAQPTATVMEEITVTEEMEIRVPA